MFAVGREKEDRMRTKGESKYESRRQLLRFITCCCSKSNDRVDVVVHQRPRFNLLRIDQGSQH